MGLAVNDPGLFTTVQDLGRPGYRAWGVPPGGAFDVGSAALANALLGNPPGAAVIELTLRGGEYEARTDLALALAGAPMGAVVEGRESRTITPPTAFPLSSGERLLLGGAGQGARAYLAVLGGWQTPEVLGSRSSETPLKAGEVVPCRPGWTLVRRLRPVWGVTGASAEAPFRVVDGPDADALDPSWFDAEPAYRVEASSNRMGLRLQGLGLPVRAGAGRVSAPVAPGAVQSAGGQPIVLGVACGTTGGYPHVAHVISADLDRLAQARPGDLIRFTRVALDLARRLDAAARSARDAGLARVRAAASDLRPWPS